MYVCMYACIYVCMCVFIYLFKIWLSVDDIYVCWLKCGTQNSNSGWLFYGLILRRYGLNVLVAIFGNVVSTVVSTAC